MTLRDGRNDALNIGLWSGNTHDSSAGGACRDVRRVVNGAT